MSLRAQPNPLQLSVKLLLERVCFSEALSIFLNNMPVTYMLDACELSEFVHRVTTQVMYGLHNFVSPYWKTVAITSFNLHGT